LRYAGRDYSLPGKYFVTICTAQKTEWFGSVINGKMHLSEIGHIASQMWYEIPDDATHLSNKTMSFISPKSGSLSVVIRSYKSAVTKHAHKLDSHFSWQHGFYDTIICTTRQEKRIRKYVLDNPQNWKDNK
jgi:hypothetical protein